MFILVICWHVAIVNMLVYGLMLFIALSPSLKFLLILVNLSSFVNTSIVVLLAYGSVLVFVLSYGLMLLVLLSHG